MSNNVQGNNIEAGYVDQAPQSNQFYNNGDLLNALPKYNQFRFRK